MKIRFAMVLIPAAVAVVFLAGCNNNAPPPKADATKPDTKATTASAPVDPEIAANLAKLSPEDRKIAEEQKTCPIAGDPLGSKAMGVPLKVVLNGQTVFICCKGCEKSALANPEKTLKTVADNKAK
jgi:outer membrane murein-binding lipoprotein Lpp